MLPARKLRVGFLGASDANTSEQRHNATRWGRPKGLSGGSHTQPSSRRQKFMSHVEPNVTGLNLNQSAISKVFHLVVPDETRGSRSIWRPGRRTGWKLVPGCLGGVSTITDQRNNVRRSLTPLTHVSLSQWLNYADPSAGVLGRDGAGALADWTLLVWGSWGQ